MATCFSGIGAPENAMPHWDSVWCAEIEKAPSAVLGHHGIGPNLGDVMASDFIDRALAMGPLDALVGGPPCQAFSIAGLRLSLDDARGNLTLRWAQIIHALKPRVVVTENVPGWLSTRDNAFGCFLAAVVGADAPLLPPDRQWGPMPHFDARSHNVHRTYGWKHIRWPSVGMVSGPWARVAWRVLDAQHFGLAQRRKRVFVIADFGNGADPAAVLFEPRRMSGDFAKGGKKRQVAPTIPSRRTAGGGLGTDFDCDGGLIEQQWPADIAPTMNAHFGDKQGLEDQHINGGGGYFVPAMCLNAHANRLDAESETLIPVNRCEFDGEAFSIMPMNSNTDYKARATDIAQPLMAGGPVSGNQGGDFVVQPIGTQYGDYRDQLPSESANDYWARMNEVEGVIPFDTTQITSKENVSNPKAGDPCHPLASGAHAPTIAFDCKASGQNGFGIGSIAGTSRAMGHSSSHTNGGGHQAALTGSGVRRLIPPECCALQGFPRDYFDGVMLRGKQMADGPIYKCLGNSMAVPVLAWILERVERFMPPTETQPKPQHQPA